MKDLIQKYDVAVPRYTSYPSVPYWENESFDVEKWKKALQHNFEQSHELSLYLHLPFCEHLCTYCACNKRITTNHAVEMPYIKALLTEWNLYLTIFGKKPLIKEIHLGGGTPTFFSPTNLSFLLSNIFDKAQLAPDAQMSVELHPNYTQFEHLTTLYRLGFRRLSVGIQDFDAKVQFAINRSQTYQQTAQIFDWARYLAYDSINADLVYGLPFQTLESINQTVEQVLKLRPERIAFYAYAHVPWKSKSQRHYTESDLPQGQTKRTLYESARNALIGAGYQEIGIDHFALPQDELHVAFTEKKLHRNFMGYTTQASPTLLGLGASSISDAWGAFAQNLKTVEEYQKCLEKGELPIEKGHILTTEDLFIRKQILNIMCQAQSHWTDEDNMSEILARLQTMQAEGLLFLEKNSLQVSQQGKVFLRNIAMQFDLRLWAKETMQNVFSRAI